MNRITPTSATSTNRTTSASATKNCLYVSSTKTLQEISDEKALVNISHRNQGPKCDHKYDYRDKIKDCQNIGKKTYCDGCGKALSKLFCDVHAKEYYCGGYKCPLIANLK